MAADIVETPKGRCAVNPIGGDYTLCGDASDLASDEPGYEWKPARARSVTCEDCAAIIRALRGVRVASS